MRYYNENPQVEYWKDKFEKLKSENLTLHARIEELVHDVKKQSSFRQDEYRRYRDWKKELESELNDEIEKFNSLPWYKKMFYKFKLDK